MNDYKKNDSLFLATGRTNTVLSSLAIKNSRGLEWAEQSKRDLENVQHLGFSLCEFKKNIDAVFLPA